MTQPAPNDTPASALENQRASVVVSHPAGMTLRVPANHPKAQALVAFALECCRSLDGWAYEI